ADPPAEATTSQASSPSANRATVDCRFWPDLAPTVVRYSRSWPWNLSPDRRCQPIATRLRARVTAFDGGTRAPPGPPRAFWKRITPVLPAGAHAETESAPPSITRAIIAPRVP